MGSQASSLVLLPRMPHREWEVASRRGGGKHPVFSTWCEGCSVQSGIVQYGEWPAWSWQGSSAPLLLSVAGSHHNLLLKVEPSSGPRYVSSVQGQMLEDTCLHRTTVWETPPHESPSCSPRSEVLAQMGSSRVFEQQTASACMRWRLLSTIQDMPFCNATHCGSVLLASLCYLQELGLLENAETGSSCSEELTVLVSSRGAMHPTGIHEPARHVVTWWGASQFLTGVCPSA